MCHCMYYMVCSGVSCWGLPSAPGTIIGFIGCPIDIIPAGKPAGMPMLAGYYYY